MSRKFLASVLASTGLAVAAPCTSAQTLPTMRPYDGASGYQDISLGPDVWYVAYHGTSKHSEAQVDAAFWLRASQLCTNSGKQYIVELVYIGEQVFKSDSPLSSKEAPDPAVIKVALPMWFIGYLANEIANPTRVPLSFRLDTPTRMAPIRCISDPAGHVAGVPPVSTEAAREKAHQLGIK